MTRLIFAALTLLIAGPLRAEQVGLLGELQGAAQAGQTNEPGAPFDGNPGQRPVGKVSAPGAEPPAAGTAVGQLRPAGAAHDSNKDLLKGSVAADSGHRKLGDIMGPMDSFFGTVGAITIGALIGGGAGAGIGLVVGGPAGAIAGGVIGAVLGGVIGCFVGGR